MRGTDFIRFNIRVDHGRDDQTKNNRRVRYLHRVGDCLRNIFFSAVFRPDEIIYLSENSLKIFVRGKAKVIPLTEIVSLNYNRIMFATSMSKLGAGHLYVATADKTYTVGYVRSVRSVYEELIIAVDRKKPFSGNPAE